jgi:RNA polymerase sigma factor (sigma-70 family)
MIAPSVRRFLVAGVAPDLSDGELLELFAARREEAAFEALVRRHGAMVLGVCRRLLRHPQDAEDAFQATFLVLARRASAVRKHESVGSWLYGVAYRVALKARARDARRLACEREVEAMPPVGPVDQVLGQEVRAVLDEELARLPERYRATLVLCGLEGKSQEEAARELGWPAGSMSRWLRRGRELLRQRLLRRGIAVSAAALAAALADGAAEAAPAQALVAGVVRAATTGVVSAPVGALTEGVLRAMFRNRLQRVVTAALLLGVAGVGVGTGARWALAARAPDAPKETAVPDQRTETVRDFPPGPPRMVTQGQKPAPDGGRVVLYSRSRHGNYPVATYAFHLGLRGDDSSVANDVNLVFGNAERDNGFTGPPVDGVPGVNGNGACGMDGGPASEDAFRVGCVGRCEHRILDLGFADYASLRAAPRAIEDDWDDDGTAVVHAGHVYAILVYDPDHPKLREPRYVKLKVLRHRDNDRVLFEWAWLRPPGAAGKEERPAGANRVNRGAAGKVRQRPHQERDTFPVTEEQRAAAARLPAAAADDVKDLLSDDVDTYLAARRRVLARGPACRALVADAARRAAAEPDRRRRMRLASVLAELDGLEPAERRLRVTEEALRRAAALRQARGKKAGKVEALVSRAISDLVRQHPAEDPYAGMCYFSFPTERSGYEGAVSLEFGNGGDVFSVLMYGGQRNRIQDLGAMDFAGVKTPPEALTAFPAKLRLETTIPAVVDHVYVEHCLEPRDGVDQMVKFQVLDLKPGAWVVIAWEPIPQEK